MRYFKLVECKKQDIKGRNTPHVVLAGPDDEDRLAKHSGKQLDESFTIRSAMTVSAFNLFPDEVNKL